MKRILTLVLALLTLTALLTPAALAADSVTVCIDLYPVAMDTQPEIRDGRTMVPIRAVAERLGAQVQWDQSAKRITMDRAGTRVVMTVGQTTALVNGESVQMDVAPYISGGRTLIPARYVAEFFGQTVSWNAALRRVDIQEDKSVVGGSNMEAWAKPMGAYLTYANRLDPEIFGAYRGSKDYGSQFRSLLGSATWGIESRADLIETVCSMTLYGHNMSFYESVALIESMTDAEYRQVLASASEVDRYMFPYTRQLWEKWGERGIICWDLFRMSNLVQWGYLAGYVTYEEALALLEPAAILLSESFSSWDEAYENYLDGYNWWARNDVLNQDIWETGRAKTYKNLRSDPETAPIFDDTLFAAGVIGGPRGTLPGLLEEIN